MEPITPDTAPAPRLTPFDFILAGLSTIAIVSLIYFDLFDFRLWSQVEDIRQKEYDLAFLFTSLNPHFPRYLLVLPVYWLADVFGADPNIIYPPLMSTLLVLLPTYAYISMTWTHVSRTTAFLAYLLFLGTYIALGTLMNGRILWAHIGITLIATHPIFHESKNANFKSSLLSFLHLFIGMLTASVSSGTLLVAYLSTALLVARDFFALSNKQKARFSTYPKILVLILFSPWILIGAIKNIDFYGGGIEGLTKICAHGTLCSSDEADTADSSRTNQFLESHKKALLLASLAPPLILAALYRKSGIKLTTPPETLASWSMMPIILSIGQLGFSTLTLEIPITLLLFSYWLHIRASGWNASAQASPPGQSLKDHDTVPYNKPRR